MKNLFSCLISSFIAFAGFSPINAQSFLKKYNPYEIGPTGRNIEDLAGFAKPNQMFSVVPNRPIVATDSSGNKQYYSPSGNLSLSISKEGKATFTLNSVTATLDADGKLEKLERQLKGTNIVEIQNEHGNILGYKELGLGGKPIREYDKDNNLSTTYEYDKYGKNMVFSTNEMSKRKTVFNDKGQMLYDLDFEGNPVKKYEYDENGKLAKTTDENGIATIFDGHQNMLYTELNGQVVSKFTYGYDSHGNYVLKSSMDMETEDITYYDKGNQTYTINKNGEKITDYCWNGTTLVFSFSLMTQETTWYDVDGKTLYVTVDTPEGAKITTKYLYYKGQQVGMWDAVNLALTILNNERYEMSLNFAPVNKIVDNDKKITEVDTGTVGNPEYIEVDSEGHPVNTWVGSEDGKIKVEYKCYKEPSAEDVKEWVEAGILDKKNFFGPL
ncbi:MAG: hypothetical protein LBU55_03540 [Elusimicrobiota bacterium]|jgi:hypothetical protein|nr:hypothetical protein [Elusimicrobiota bacterium]